MENITSKGKTFPLLFFYVCRYDTRGCVGARNIITHYNAKVNRQIAQILFFVQNAQMIRTVQWTDFFCASCTIPPQPTAKNKFVEM
jgi:hypothetical protein